MLLINANIWTMEERDYPRGYVLVRDGRIAGAGPMEECPNAGEGEDILDLGGKLLLPGFIDAHTHLGLFSTGLGLEGDDINDDADPVTPHLRALDGIDPYDEAFAEARSGGVTCAVISPGSANAIAGQVCAVKTRGRWVDEMVVAQPLAIKIALGENPKMTHSLKPQAPVTRMGTAALIREQLQKAGRYGEELQRAQEDEEIDPPEFDARCEALLPLLRGEIAAHIHAHKAYDILTGVRLAKEFSLRSVIVHGTEGYLVADILAKLGIGVICGPLFCAKTKPELAGLDVRNAGLLARAGVPVAVSTDYPEAPQGLLLMSASMVRSEGLDTRAALKAITIGAARVVGLEGRLGSIAVGKDADMAVFEGDPMEIGAKPVMLFINGEWEAN